MGCCTSAAVPPRAAVADRKLDCGKFAGKWYVTHSNLRMWQENKNPTITYTAEQLSLQPTQDTGAVLDDLVQYESLSGSKKSVRGVDTQPFVDHPTAFQWCGAGCLRCVTSRWCVVAHDPQYAVWAVTYFTATPFTKEGMDIYSRTPDLADAAQEEALQAIREHPVLAPMLPTLQACLRDDNAG